MPVDETK